MVTRINASLEGGKERRASSDQHSSNLSPDWGRCQRLFLGDV